MDQQTVDYLPEILERWNRGEVSPSELVQAIATKVIKRYLDPFESNIYKERLRQALWRDKPRIFISMKDFLAYARLVTSHGDPELEMSQANPRMVWPYNFYAEDEDPDDQETLKRIELLEKLDQEEISGAQPISLASPGFAPREALPYREGFEVAAIVEKLREVDIGLARVAVLRLFGGLTLKEIASRTSQSSQSLRRDWEKITKELVLLGHERVVPILILPADSALLKALHAHPDLLKTLDWRSFEKILASILELLGFEIELQRGTKDGGIDIFALKGDPTLGAHRYLIQAKRWSNRVGVEAVRELLFLQGHYRATKGCLATTATFSRGAWRLADEYKWQLELRDIRGIQDWIEMALRRH